MSKILNLQADTVNNFVYLIFRNSKSASEFIPNKRSEERATSSARARWHGHHTHRKSICSSKRASRCK